ncbi:hypothetical protein U8C36_09755 [Sinorhizobium medicae]|nr:hypothetical protein [Sinorhizobium medicae]WQO53834.1 hypothetical protein U8C36_09755 [Sinorhizobium medicae]
MNTSVLIACIAVVLWMAALTLVVPGLVERDFRRNGFKAKVRR